jgi:hypothetical protein
VQSSTFSFDSRLDEVFEARLAGREKDWIFLRGFCFHPVETKKFILSEVKKHRKDADLDRRLLILNLLKMNMRMDQYKHVPLEKIYFAEKL